MSGILFAGTDRWLSEMTVGLLRRNGFDVIKTTFSIPDALAEVHAQEVELVVADLDVSEEERIHFCRAIKSSGKRTKLLLITESEEDEITFLNAGADDWMKKPYRMRVLYARINALLRL